MGEPSEMVARAAAAIANGNGTCAGNKIPCAPGCECVRDARAAIAATRGTFDVTAGIAALGSDDDRPAASVVYDVFCAVIDAALVEGEP